MNSEFLLAQAVGLLAFFVGITAFLQRDDQAFRRQLTVFSGVMGAHFFLMGAPSAGISASLSGVRSLASSHTRSVWVMSGFILLVWAMGLPKAEHPMQILPLVGTTIGTWGLFRLQGFRMRLCMLSGTVLWFSHNLWLGSIGGSLIEGSFLFVNSLTIYRLWKQPSSASVAVSVAAQD